MLKLYSVNNQDVVYTFLGGRKYVVGRKNGNVILPSDQSISRHHADVEVSHPHANIDNPALQPTLMVTDFGSKFGTFINEQIDLRPGIPIRQPVNLKGGSRVRFGRQSSEFKFEYTPLVITCSTLKDTAQLKELMCQLGGHLVREWSSDCRYVVMDSVTLTIKAVCALLAGGYIVSPNYFIDLIASVLTSQPANLDPMDYTPPLAEADLSSTNVNFKPLPARSRLFRGKTFLCCNNKQMKKLEILVKTGGGNTKLILDCPTSELGSADILMMSVEVSLLDKTTVKAIDMYKASGKRLIQESEISLAAVYVNIGKHCNPYFGCTQRIFPPMSSQTQRSPYKGSVIIPETQLTETQQSEGPYSPIFIEDSDMTDYSDQSCTSVLTGTQINSKKNPGIGVKSGEEEREDAFSSTRRMELKRQATTHITLASTEEPETKRQKSSGIESRMSSFRRKTLSTLFNLSDSEEEDEESSIQSGIGGISQQLRMTSDMSDAQPIDVDAETNNVSTPVSNPDSEVIPGTPGMSPEDFDIFAGLVLYNHL